MLSCDNLLDSGATARTTVVPFPRLRDPELAPWIDEHVTFPSRRVDRIKPRDLPRDPLLGAHGVFGTLGDDRELVQQLARRASRPDPLHTASRTRSPVRDQADHLRDLPTRALLLDAEERRLATTSKNARTTAVDLAVADGVPVEASLAARHPGAARTDPVLTEALLEHWVQEQPLAAAARLSA